MKGSTRRATIQPLADFGAGFLQGAKEAPRLFFAPLIAVARRLRCQDASVDR